MEIAVVLLPNNRSTSQRHRSNLEIMYTILRYVALEGKAKKTHILYHASLNSRSLERFLQRLIESGFLETVEGEHGTLYTITMKGRQALRTMAQLMKLMSPEDSVRRVDLGRLVRDAEVSARSPGRVLGRSGIMHSFDLVLGEGSNKLVATVVDPRATPDELIDAASRFIVGVLDTGLRGVIFVPMHMVAWARSLLSSIGGGRRETRIDVITYSDEQGLIRAVRTSALSVAQARSEWQG